MSGSGNSWAVCKSAPRSRQITTPAPHHSVLLQAGCPSCCPTNSVKALKAIQRHNYTNSFHTRHQYRLSRGFMFHSTQNRSAETFPRANLIAWYGKKTKPNTTKACIHQSKEMYYNINTHTHLTALFPGIPRSAGTRNPPTWILLKQEMVTCSQYP